MENCKAHITVTHFLQLVHTHFNKAIPPNCVTTYEIMEFSYIQITTARQEDVIVLIQFGSCAGKFL